MKWVLAAAVGALVFLVVQHLWHNKMGMPAPGASAVTPTTALPVVSIDAPLDKLNLTPTLSTGMGSKKGFF